MLESFYTQCNFTTQQFSNDDLRERRSCNEKQQVTVSQIFSIKHFIRLDGTGVIWLWVK